MHTCHKKGTTVPPPFSPLSMGSKPAATPECHLKPGDQPMCVEAAAAEQEYFTSFKGLS